MTDEQLIDGWFRDKALGLETKAVRGEILARMKRVTTQGVDDLGPADGFDPMLQRAVDAAEHTVDLCADDAPDCTCNIAIGPNDTWPVPHNEACPVTHWARDQFRKSGENAQGADDAQPVAIPAIFYNGDTKRDPPLRAACDEQVRSGIAIRDAAPIDQVKAYERHDPDHATEPFLAFIPDAKRDELIGALLDDLKRSDCRETDFYMVRWFIGGLGLLAAASAPRDK